MTDNRSWRGRASLSIFGRRTVLDAIDAARDKHITIHDLRLSRELPAEYRRDALAAAEALGIDARECKPAAVRELSRDPRHDQGVAARITLERVTDADAFAASIHGPAAATPTRLIALDGITNPQNVGMCLRATVGAGFEGVLWPLEGSPWVSGLLIKASASAVFRAAIATCDTLDRGLDSLAARGFRIAGLDGNAKTDLWTHEPPHRACYVVGSETRGLSKGTIDRLDHALRIPMNPAVESLNAATAAAVLAFHVARLTPEGPPPR